MKNISSLCLYVGYIGVLFSAVIFPNHIKLSESIEIAPIVMAIGASLMAIYKTTTPISGIEDSRAKRLQFQQQISVILYFLTAYLMYSQDKRWVVSLLVATIIEIIILLRVPSTKK